MCAYLTKKELTEEFGGLHKKVESLAKGVVEKVEEIKAVFCKVAEAEVVGAAPVFTGEEVKAISGAFSKVLSSLATSQEAIVEGGLTSELAVNPYLGLLRLKVSKVEAIKKKEAEAEAVEEAE